jgi:hypothetical protein
LFLVIVLVELLGPAIGPWAVWSGRLIAGIMPIYIVFLGLGGEGSGTLIMALDEYRILDVEETRSD